MNTETTELLVHALAQLRQAIALLPVEHAAAPLIDDAGSAISWALSPNVNQPDRLDWGASK